MAEDILLADNIKTYETTVEERIKLIKTDFAKFSGYNEGVTTLKNVIADNWSAHKIPNGGLGIHGFIANKGYIGLLFAYSKNFLKTPNETIANAVEKKFNQRLNDYILNITPNVEWIYNYNRSNNETNITRVCDLIFENGVLVEKMYLI